MASCALSDEMPTGSKAAGGFDLGLPLFMRDRRIESVVNSDHVVISAAVAGRVSSESHRKSEASIIFESFSDPIFIQLEGSVAFVPFPPQLPSPGRRPGDVP